LCFTKSLRLFSHTRLTLCFIYRKARWTYNNTHESLLTKVQAISLNCAYFVTQIQRVFTAPLSLLAHTLFFSITDHIRCEQFARHAAGVFFNFNGTAGTFSLNNADGVNSQTQ
jgi:hypothetical protein